ncbi:MAG TPA: hypothetical protein VFW07_27685 [Parafilimonas sp.]|nr:hypothetical protein [Parafilimonas sp.]
MNLLLVHSFTWITVVLTGVIAFILGFIIKSTIVYKQRKRILRLEDEMLSNHSRILELEQIATEVHKEKTGSPQDYDRNSRKDQLRVS